MLKFVEVAEEEHFLRREGHHCLVCGDEFRVGQQVLHHLYDDALVDFEVHKFCVKQLVDHAPEQAGELEPDVLRAAIKEQGTVYPQLEEVRNVDLLVRPMLAEPTTKILVDSDWIVEPKMDGQRLLIQVDDGNVRLYNRAGVYSNLSPSDMVIEPFRWFTDSWLFDGEYVKGTYWVFDLLYARMNLIREPWFARHAALKALFEEWPFTDNVQRVVAVDDPSRVEAFVDSQREAGNEGVVFKHAESIYRPGRQDSWRKYKFTKTVDCVVMTLAVGGKDNCSVGLFWSPEDLREVAKVSLKGKSPVQPGDVVEIRYLYRTSKDRLYQPVLLSKRGDKTAAECTVEQMS